jgi:hypothetical protein
MTQRFADVVAGYIRKFPAQWGVFFKVWMDGQTLSAEEVAAAQRPVWGRGTSGSRPATQSRRTPPAGQGGAS